LNPVFAGCRESTIPQRKYFLSNEELPP